jgi:LuxR family maltose regulon positive regulatory protein
MAEQPPNANADPVLVSTKLRPPVDRDLVARPELVAALQRPARLTIISAAPGAGKTSLLASWYAAEGLDAAPAFVAIDEGDNDPTRLWSHIIGALAMVDPAVGKTSLPVLQAGGQGAVRRMLVLLVNELSSTLQPTVLTLDDYHFLRSPEIHDGVGFLVQYLPDHIRMVISTRSTPPLPLAVLRAHGELIELGTADLRFSVAETAALMSSVPGIALNPDEVSRLWERTEGWAAGLYLAALSLRGRHDPHEFVTRFAGDDRHVVDFLGSEVLQGQPPPVRDFMLRTSILDRLRADVCTAVAGIPDASQLLEQIERSNLFLVPLDSTRTWYRYHHLFAQLLRLELEASEPGLVPELHRRAARWLSDAGSVTDAIRHTIAAGDHQDAAELIARHWNPFVQMAQDATVAGWLAALPERVAAADARLCVAGAITDLSMHRLASAEQWLAKAERVEAAGPLYDGFSSIATGIAIGRAILAQNLGDIPGTAESAARVLALEPAPSSWRAVAHALCGIARRWQGDVLEAEQQLREGVDLARAAGTPAAMTVVYGLGHLAALEADREEWDQARAYADEALEAGANFGIVEHYVCGLAQIVLGMRAVHDQDWATAEGLLRKGIDLARRGAEPHDAAYGHLALAITRQCTGDPDGAGESMRQAEQLLNSCLSPATLLPRLVAQTSRRVYSTSGSLAKPQPGSAPPPPSLDSLSVRELSVLRLLDSTLSQREIAESLYVSINTVKTHTSSIFRKLAVTNRRDAVVAARNLGLSSGTSR